MKKSCFYFINYLVAPYIKLIKYLFLITSHNKKTWFCFLISFFFKIISISESFQVFILYSMPEAKKCSTFHSLVTHLSLQSFKQRLCEISVLCGWLIQELLRKNMTVIVLILMGHQRSASSSNHPHLL